MGALGAALEWGVASRRLAGEPESGDLHLVKAFDGGVLVAVVDGLGHGPEAAAAASRAVVTLKAHAAEPVDALLKRCDEALRGTRGAVLSLASFNTGRREMTWVGLGNVEGLLLTAHENGERERQSLVMRGGVLGSRLPPVHPAALPIRPGDTLILATDGVRADFATGDVPAEAPQRLADRILTRWAKATDDALVLVARFTGAPA